MFYQIAFALSSALAVQGHVALTFPPPFNAAYNPSTPPANVDYSITSPLSSDGSNYPCKIAGGGVLSPSDPGGESQVTWLQGEAANFTTGGGAIHAGGSCQASLSFDQGKTWKVIHSYIGDCPIGPDQKHNVAIPSDAPTGPAVFQWSWANRVGNREFYANCAAITIAEASRKRDAPVVPFDGRPAPFTANIGNGCETVEGKDVDFPNPGPDVTRKSQDGAASVSGNCGAVQAPPDVAGGSSGDTTTTTTTADSTSTTAVSQPSNDPSGTDSTASESGDSSGQCIGTCRGSAGVVSPLPDANLHGNMTTNSTSTIETSTTQSVVTSQVSTSAIVMASSVVGPQSPPAAPSAIPSTSISRPAPVSVLNKNLVISPDGTCSLNSYTCTGYAKGSCCSQFGYCGSSPGHCGEGCQTGFGTCQGSSSAQASNSTVSSLRGNLTSAATSVKPNTSTTTLVALSVTALSLLSTLSTLATMATGASDGARGGAAIPTTACASYRDQVASVQESTKTKSTTEGIAAVTPIVSGQGLGFRGRLRT